MMADISHTPGLNIRLRLFYLVVFLSGLAGLGYQMVWTRLLTVSLGHEMIAVIAVVAAFFVGLALGGFALNRMVHSSRLPHYWYIGLELVIALWSLALTQLMPLYNEWLPTLIGATPSAWRHWFFAFGASLLVLLPATFAMGATLPTMERMSSVLWRRSHKLAGLYGANTLGAVLGTVSATFFLIPNLGLHTTQWLLAAINLLCALSIPLLFYQRIIPDTLATVSTASTGDYPATPISLLLFCSGLLGIGYEILVVRILSQILENTVYSFAAILAVYLVGISMGAWLYQLKLSALRSAVHWSQRLIQLLSLTGGFALFGIGCLWLANLSYPHLLQWIALNTANAVLVEFIIAALVFLLPTISMGALFSHLACHGLHRNGLGNALGWNTLGSAVAPLVFGIILLPTLGAKVALLLIPLGYLLLTATQHNIAVTKRLQYAALPATLCLVVLLQPNPLRFITSSEQDQIVEYRDGIMAAVAVVEDSTGNRHLKVNNHFTMGGTASRLSDHRQSHLPLLLHGSPDNALYLGLGTGITFEATQFYPDLSTTAVELIPEAIELMPRFGVQVNSSDWRTTPKIIAADARRFVLSSDQSFDVIVAEIFHPSRDGAGSLYTREHFAAIKGHLSDNGVFCQWLPLFQLDLDTLRTIIRTFIEVFPIAQLHLGHFSLDQPILCLAGYQSPPSYQPDWLLERVHYPPLQQQLVQSRLNSDFALFGGYLGGNQALARFSADGPINTDDYPIVTYQAPRFVYQPQNHPSARLLTLLESMAPHRGSLLADTAAASEFTQRLQSYWQARDRFIEVGQRAHSSDSVRQLMVASKDPLLDIVRSSEEFAPAYRTLLMSAQSLAQENPIAAYGLLSELHNASPQQAAALQLRQRLFGN